MSLARRTVPKPPSPSLPRIEKSESFSPPDDPVSDRRSVFGLALELGARAGVAARIGVELKELLGCDKGVSRRDIPKDEKSKVSSIDTSVEHPPASTKAPRRCAVPKSLRGRSVARLTRWETHDLIAPAAF